jgi:hypothetical protein
VECDGATYHRSATARDRDKLREQVLRGLGWQIVRVWSTDWWVNPGGTLERVHEGLTVLLEQDRQRRAEEAAQDPQQDAADAAGGNEPAPDPLAVDEAAAAIARAAERAAAADDAAAPDAQYARAASAERLAAPALGDAPAGRRYDIARPADAVPPGTITPERFHDIDYDQVLEAMVACVVQQEGPVLDAVLARRIARAHGFQRTGSRIQERVERIARQRFGMTEEAGGTFYWPEGVVPGVDVDFRAAGDDEGARSVQEICEQELLPLARRVLRTGRTGDEAVIAMARAMGVSRLAASSRGRLEQVLDGAGG